MGLIASIDGPARRVYLDASEVIGGVLSFHPTADLYPEYKALRAADESVRPFDAFLEARGNEPKNQDGTKRTPRYTRLLSGTKLVIPAGVTRLNVTGELLSDDGSDPFDRSLVTGACFIDYTPPVAEIIRVTTTGNEYTLAQIAESVLDSVVEQALDLRGAMRLLLSFAAGNARGLDGTAPSFRDLADTKDRITATMGGDGTRTVTARDAS